MQHAVIGMCQSSTLVELRINGFWILPSTFLSTNPGLRDLGIGNVFAFSRLQLQDNLRADVAAEPTLVPPVHFRGLRNLYCTILWLNDRNDSRVAFNRHPVVQRIWISSCFGHHHLRKPRLEFFLIPIGRAPSN